MEITRVWAVAEKQTHRMKRRNLYFIDTYKKCHFERREKSSATCINGVHRAKDFSPFLVEMTRVCYMLLPLRNDKGVFMSYCTFNIASASFGIPRASLLFVGVEPPI